MASSIGFSEKGIKVTKKEGSGSASISIGPDSIGIDRSAGPVTIGMKSDGSFGGKISNGGFSVGADSKGGFSVETPIGGIEYNSDGSGSIKAPFGIAGIDVKKEGCTYVLKTFLAGGLIDTEVRKIPDCQEPPPEPPPKPPEPPEPGTFSPFDPGTINLPDTAIVIATFDWRFTGSIVMQDNRDTSGTGFSTDWDYNESTISDVPYAPYTYENNYEYRFDGYYAPTGGWVYTEDHTYVLFSKDNYRHKEKRVGTLWTQSANHTVHVNDNLNMTFFSGYNPPKVIGPANYNYDTNFITYHYLIPHDFENGYPKYYYGKWNHLKSYISKIQYKQSWSWSDDTGSGSGFRIVQLANLALYSNSGEQKGGIPPSMSNCCNQQKVDLARLEEKLDMLLAVTEAEALTKIGYSIPASLIAFGADAKSKLKIQSIPGYLNFIMREIDHYGISPIKINIKDIDPTQEGDQSLSEQYINGTAAIKRILELLHGQKGTDKLRLNLQARIASMLDMVLASVTAINELLESVTVYIDMPLKEKIEKYKQPWDPYIGLKGFSQKQAWEKELNKKLKEDMEKNIADMCNDSERSVVVQKFNGKADRLVQLIQKLLIGMKH